MNKDKIIAVQPLGFPWATQDPFLFCAYHADAYPKGNEQMGPAASLAGRNIGQDFTVKDGWRMYHGSTVPGFPYHPHRGFETITIAKQGMVDHTDSLGAAGRFGNGDVQWMTAGKGLQHSEMFPLLQQDKENPLVLFQIWLNLPKASKMVDPHFSMLWAETIPVLEEKDDQGKVVTVDVIAGRLKHLNAPDPAPNSWAADLENEVAVWTIKLEAGAKWTIPAAKTAVNRTFYFYRGHTLDIEGQSIAGNHAIQVQSQARINLQAGDEAVYLLMLQGKPIKEPVVQYGPFVMNTRQEIQEAFAEYQKTEFGGWPWPKREYVHDRKEGRFALYADGSKEVK